MYILANHFKENFYIQYLQKAPFKNEFLTVMNSNKIIIGENLTNFFKMLKQQKSEQDHPNVHSQRNSIHRIQKSQMIIPNGFQLG